MKAKRPKLTILDVGHGNAAVLECAGQNVVLDAGTGSSLLEYLKESNIRVLHQVFLSHADEDHIGGVSQLLASHIKIRRVWVNTDSLKDTAVWDDVLLQLEKKSDLRVGLTSYAKKPKVFAVGSAILEVLAPSPFLAGKGPGSRANGKRLTSNSISAVIRVRHKNGRGVLFTGDLDAVGLLDIDRRGVSLDADLLVYPHHGGQSGGSMTKQTDFAKDLISRVEPGDVVFSIGRGGKHPGNPQPHVVTALRTAAPKLRIACTQLSTHCASAPPPPHRGHHLLPIFSHGRATNACCAGSVGLEFPLPLRPVRSRKHVYFIKKHAPTALCV